MNSILIIGVTSDLGKSFFETLLRSNYQGVIGLLIRDKNGELSTERFYNLISTNCFTLERKKFYDNKIKVISGDLLTFKTDNVFDNYDVIVNCITTINFELSLKDAYDKNVKIINIIKKIANNLKCKKLIHISSAYVNHPINKSNHTFKEELVDLGCDKLLYLSKSVEINIFYESILVDKYRNYLNEIQSNDIDFNSLYKDLKSELYHDNIFKINDIEFSSLYPHKVKRNVSIDLICYLIEHTMITFDEIKAESQYNNTYTFTKSLAEHVFLDDLYFPKENCFIIRPSIITSAITHPFPGWISNEKSINEYLKLFMTNNIQIMKESPDILNKINLIPIDLVSQCIYNYVNDTSNEKIKHCVSEDHKYTKKLVDYMRRINSISYNNNSYNYYVIKNNFIYKFLEKLFDIQYIKVKIFILKFLFYFTNLKKYSKQKKLLENTMSKIKLFREYYNYFNNNKYVFEVSKIDYSNNYNKDTYPYLIVNGICSNILEYESDNNVLSRNKYIEKIILQRNFNIFHWISLSSPIIKNILKKSFDNIKVNIIDKYKLLNNWDHKYIIVADNKSDFDTLIIKYILDSYPGLMIKNPYVITTNELDNIFIVSKLLKLSRMIFINSNNYDIIKYKGQILDILDDNENILFYFKKNDKTTNQNNIRKTLFKTIIDIIKFDKMENVSILPIKINYNNNEIYNNKIRDYSLTNTISWLVNTKENYGSVEVGIENPIKIEISDDFYEIYNKIIESI